MMGDKDISPKMFSEWSKEDIRAQEIENAAKALLAVLVLPFCALSEKGDIAKLMQAGLKLHEALREEPND